MAAGSHALKGTWALFVKALRISNHTKTEASTGFSSKTILKLENQSLAPLPHIKSPSPVRLVKKVNKPALRDLVFL